jgi:N-carbamoyl-L-amino-acid hydrolase
MRINGQRLRESLLRMAQIGRTPSGGVTRLALTDEDKRARDLLCQWLVDAKLELKVDDVGNIFGWLGGTENSLPPVLMGSHLDTVREGGMFDGSLGVLAALEVLRSLKEREVRTRRRLGIVAFTGEEGARFEPAILGPSVMAERFTLEHVYSLRDRWGGPTFGEELERIGYRGDANNRSPVPLAFLELHVEQGPILEQEQVSVGVVEGVVGITWLQVVLHGQANHAGPTPLNARRDALVGAARIVSGVREIAYAMGGDTVATVGRLTVEPDIINVIPGLVNLGIDLRHTDPGRLEFFEDLVRNAVKRAADKERLDFTFERVGHQPTTRFDSNLIQLIEQTAQESGLSQHRLIAGAGHDSQWMARICPTAMIFVPSKDGRSHCPEEETSWEAVSDGASLLASVIEKLCQL